MPCSRKFISIEKFLPKTSFWVILEKWFSHFFRKLRIEKKSRKYSIFRNQKTTRQLQEEREERERLEFLAEMKKGESKEKSDVLEEDSKPEKDISQEDLEGKILKITRKKQEIDGTETVETIEIKKPEVIEAYLKIKV